MKRLFLFFIPLFFVSTLIGQTTWTLDKNHTEIGFTATHMVITEVNGEFREFDGKVTTSSDGFEGAEVSFTAQVASIDTDVERRDNHLRSGDFFDAENYPELTFSGKITSENGSLYLVGDLTIKDVTKQEKFEVKHNGTVPGRNGRKAGFKVTGMIDRFEYGLKWDRVTEAGSLIAGKEIGITCNVELSESKEG